MKVIEKEEKIIISNYCCVEIMLDFCKDMNVEIFKTGKCNYCGKKIEFNTDINDENYSLLKTVNF